MTENSNTQFNCTSPIHQTINHSNDNSKKFHSDHFASSTPISTKNNSKSKNDSAYSSFQSQKTPLNMNSNILIKESINNESPGTSYSSRNSNDDEIEQFLTAPVNEKVTETSFFIPDSYLGRSTRNSPWSIRPDSAPLNEEEEDSDKEASNYLCDSRDPFPIVSELHDTVRCRHRGPILPRPTSMTDNDQRNELIAMKLQEIADRLPTRSENRVRHKSCVLLTENQSSSSTKRHSYSSFTDMMPNTLGSALDLMVSLYKIYKECPNKHKNNSVANSQSMHNMLNYRQKRSRRFRSYTE